MGVASQNSTLPCAIATFPVSLPLSSPGDVWPRLPLVFLPPRGHEPPPTLRDRLNPNLSLYRHRFPIPRYAKRPDVALYTVGPLFLLPTPSSTHCALKVSEHDSLWQPPAAHSEERSRPQKSSRAQRCLNALAPGNLKGTVVRGHPVVWSIALRSDDAKQDPVVYGTKFGVVFLAEGPRTASIQEGFDCFGLYHPGLERERCTDARRTETTSCVTPTFIAPRHTCRCVA